MRGFAGNAETCLSTPLVVVVQTSPNLMVVIYSKNPTSTVQWTWDRDNGSPATGTISGAHNMLSQRVTRGDDGRVIVARYNNGIGNTMQRFTVCANCMYVMLARAGCN